MKNKSANTLIEIIVAVAIIGILSGVLIPIFVSNREKEQKESYPTRLKTGDLTVEEYKN